MITKTDLLKSTEFGFDEVKDRYRIFLDKFDDIKKKAQILLLVCSLFITLPLQSEFFLKKIVSNVYLTIPFFLGICCLTIAITLLIYSLIAIKIDIPNFEDIAKSIKKYRYVKIVEATLETYCNALNANEIKFFRKQKAVDLAERFIIVGIAHIIVIIGVILL